jgi:fructan beta-fructosidase
MLRPLYHFTPEKNWINDPNGLVHLNGEWHLFYQHNPFGIDWGHMSWGHAVSEDLLHWQHLPVALQEDEAAGVMIYSGSAAVDWPNTTGMGDGLAPALIAAYTGHSAGEEDQRIAFSTDRGRTWTNSPHNPVVRIGSKDFRDPKLFWHAPTERWIMASVLADKQQVRFYGSTNLRDWQHLSDFGPAGAHTGAWECPDLFTLPVDGDAADTKWVLKVDNQQSVDGHAGSQIFIGQFDGERFVCDDPPARIRPIDHALDFYAAQSWSDAPEGRRVWLAWMTHWSYAGKLPTSPWRGMMTAPREIALRTFDDGIHLAQQPVKEVEWLRQRQVHLAGLSAAQANTALNDAGALGAALDVQVVFEAKGANAFGLFVREGAAERTAIGYDLQAGELFVDRSESGDMSFSPQFVERSAVKLLLKDNTLSLRVLVDAQSVEVFADDGRVVMSVQIFPQEASAGVSLFGDASVKSLDVWMM